MAFPLYFLLFPYLLFLLFWAVFSFVGIYHMAKFGSLNFTTFFTTFIYIGGSFILFAVSLNFIGGIDWGVNVSMLNDIFNNNVLNFSPPE